MRTKVVIVGLGIGVGVGACTQESSSACAGDFDCKGDRVCRAGQCVDPEGGDGSGSTADGGSGGSDDGNDDGGGSSGTSSGSEGGPTDSGESTGGSEPSCEDIGGQTLPTGACDIACTYNVDFPHNDRDGDCVDDGAWICQFGWNKCIIDNCQTDAECGAPGAWVCSEFGICYFSCATGGDCPSGWGCMMGDGVGEPAELICAPGA